MDYRPPRTELSSDHQAKLHTLEINDAFRSEFNDFDWTLIPETDAAVIVNDRSGPQKTRTCVYHTSGKSTPKIFAKSRLTTRAEQSFLFTEEGFVYLNKRFARRHPALAKDVGNPRDYRVKISFPYIWQLTDIVCTV